MKPLSDKQRAKHFQALSGWKLNSKETEISKIFEFQNFVAALAFCAKIAVHAEVMEHHPELVLTYGRVKVKLTTHNTKALTKLDFKLAGKIDSLRVT